VRCVHWGWAVSLPFSGLSGLCLAAVATLYIGAYGVLIQRVCNPRGANALHFQVASHSGTAISTCQTSKRRWALGADKFYRYPAAHRTLLRAHNPHPHPHTEAAYMRQKPGQGVRGERERRSGSVAGGFALSVSIPWPLAWPPTDAVCVGRSWSWCLLRPKQLPRGHPA
jgi:hypothetical protein